MAKRLREMIEERERELRSQDPFYSNQKGVMDFYEYVGKHKKKKKANEELEKLIKDLAKDQRDVKGIEESLRKFGALPQGAVVGDAVKDPKTADKIKQNAEAIAAERAKLVAAGKNPDEVIDDRNWFEKMTNLPKDQNFLLDAVELVFQRPWAGTFGSGSQMEADRINELKAFDENTTKEFIKATNEVSDGGGIDPFFYFSESKYAKDNPEKLKAFKKKYDEITEKQSIFDYMYDGWSGRREYQASLQIANQQGRDKVGKKDIVAGLGAEIMTDPLNFVGGAIAKGIGAAGKAVANTKVAKGVWESDSVKIVRDFMDKKFGSGGKNRTVTGAIDEADELRKVQTEYLAKLHNSLEDSQQAVATALQKAGGNWEDGVKVAKIMEMESIGSRIDDMDNQITQLINRAEELGVQGEDLRELIALQQQIGLMKKSDAYKDAYQTVQQGTKEANKINKQIASILAKVSEGKPVNGELVESLIKEAHKMTNSGQVKGSQIFMKAMDDKISEIVSKVDEYKAANNITGGLGSALRKVDKNYNSTMKKLEALGNSSKHKALITQYDTAMQLKHIPEMNQAAETLVQSNQMVRELADSMGIPMDDIKGYMAHILTDEAKKLKNSPAALKEFAKKMGYSDKVMNRNMKGTVDEINKFMGMEYFNPNAFFSTAVGQDRLIRFAVMEGFKKQVLANPKFAIPVEAYTGIEKNLLKDKHGKLVELDLSKYVAGSDELGEIIAQASNMSGRYYVTPGVKEALQSFKNLATRDDEVAKVVDMYDKVMTQFKKFATFSGGYHVRNLVGAMWNQYATGMNSLDVVRYNSKAMQIINASKKLQRGETLTKAEEKLMKVYDEFREAGLSGVGQHSSDLAYKTDAEIMRDIQSRGKTFGKKTLDNAMKNPLTVLDASRELGENADDATRLALFMWGKAKKGMDTGKAAGLVRKTLFDYNDLTQFEKQFMRRIAPFYTFTRKNIPFVIESFIKNPQKFSRAINVSEASMEMTNQDRELLPDYMKDQAGLGVDLPILGNNQLLLDLPFSSMNMLSPEGFTKGAKGMISPVIKAPMEALWNHSTFYDNDLNKIQDPLIDALGSTNSKNLNLAQGIGHTIQETLPLLKRLIKGTSTVAEGNDLESLIRGTLQIGGAEMMKEYDPAKFTSQLLKKQRDKLEEKIKDLQQEAGAELPTVDELRKLGLVGNTKATEEEVYKAQALMKKAEEMGLDPKVVGKLKQKASSMTEQELPPLIEMMRQLNIPDELIAVIIEGYIDTSEVRKKLATK